MRKINILAASFLSVFIFNAHAQHSHYAGMESREIKTLSQQDIEELRRGGG